MKVKVNFYQLTNFTKQSDLNKAENIRLLIEDVINDETFRTKILSADFKDRRFINTDRSTEEINSNEEILKRILSGKEQYRTEGSDQEWDYKIVLFRSLKREIGHRSRETIYTKKRIYRSNSERFIAAHWIHEYIHVIGFTHDHKRTPRRPFSVPYLIGKIAADIMESKNYDFLS